MDPRQEKEAAGRVNTPKNRRFDSSQLIFRALGSPGLRLGPGFLSSPDQPSLWESVLPEEVLRLSEQLAKVDALLEDERFFAPFREGQTLRQRLCNLFGF